LSDVSVSGAQALNTSILAGGTLHQTVCVEIPPSDSNQGSHSILFWTFLIGLCLSISGIYLINNEELVKNWLKHVNL
jgi:hypothetical protein